MFLLSLTALSICTFNMVGKRFAGIGISGGGPSRSIQISAPCNNAEYNGWELDFGMSSQEDDFGGALVLLQMTQLCRWHQESINQDSNARNTGLHDHVQIYQSRRQATL